MLPMLDGPVEGAFINLPRKSPIPSLSGRSSFMYLGGTRLGVVLQLPGGRLATLPWPALEGCMSLLQSGGWVRVGQSPIEPPIKPTTIAEYISHWSRYRNAANWAAALLSTVGVVEVNVGSPRRVRLLPEAFPEAVRWNRNLASLTSRRALELEMKTAVFYIQEGLSALVQLRDQAFFPASIFLLGSGLEHLFKLGIILGELDVRGRLPSWRKIQHYKHDLVALREAMLDLLMESNLGGFEAKMPQEMLREYLTGPWLAAKFVQFASEFVSGTRYAYVDELLGRGLQADPVSDFQALEEEVVELSRDPENPGRIPGLLDVFLEKGEESYFRDRNLLVVEQLMPSISHYARICYRFLPLKDPGALSWLMYYRWETEIPPVWLARRPLRHPRIWLDHLLDNDRWQKHLEGTRNEHADD
jgi:hypothetical protein